jgi:hypothetical protein
MNDIKEEDTKPRERALKFLKLIKEKMAKDPKKITARKLAKAISANEDTVYALFRGLKSPSPPHWMKVNLNRLQSAWIEGLIVYLKFSTEEVREIFPSLSHEEINSLFEKGVTYLKNAEVVSTLPDFALEIGQLAPETVLTEADVKSLFAFVRTTGREVTLLECLKFILCLKKPLG